MGSELMHAGLCNYPLTFCETKCANIHQLGHKLWGSSSAEDLPFWIGIGCPRSDTRNPKNFPHPHQLRNRIICREGCREGNYYYSKIASQIRCSATG